MAVNFKFELVSPERVLMSEDVEHVVLPGIEGDMGVLAGHAPFVVTLRPGVITVLGGDSPRKVYVKDGFAEFTPDTLNVLAEQAVNLSEQALSTGSSRTPRRAWKRPRTTPSGSWPVRRSRRSRPPDHVALIHTALISSENSASTSR